MLERASLVPAAKYVTLWRVKLKYIVGPLSSDTHRVHVIHGTRYRIRHLCMRELNVFCMHAFRVSKLDLPISSLIQSFVVQARKPEIRHTPQYNSTVQCPRARCQAPHATRPTEPIACYTSMRLARALSSLKNGKFGRSDYYSPPRLFFMFDHSMLRRRRSSEHLTACSMWQRSFTRRLEIVAPENI